MDILVSQSDTMDIQLRKHGRYLFKPSKEQGANASICVHKADN
jgi:hypothetical protein